jgi:hypothetical protein
VYYTLPLGLCQMVYRNLYDLVKHDEFKTIAAY